MKYFLRALSGETLNRPPFWLMRQAGRYLPEYREIRKDVGGFVELCLNPEMAAEVTLQPIRRYGMDAAILFSDILMVPYGLGSDLRFAEGEGPIVGTTRSAEEVKKLDPSRFHERVGKVYETVSRVADELDDDTVLIGFSGAPWTVATYMVEGGSSKDFQQTKAWAYRDPEGFKQLIDAIVAITAEYLIAQVNAGAEVLKIFDSWAGVLPEPAFRNWVIEPTKELIAKVKAVHPDIPIIGFPRGAGALYPEFAKSVGANAVALDVNTPVEWAAENLQNILPVQGNLDPIALVAGGDLLKAEIERIVSALRSGPYIFNLGHGVVPSTPPEHVGELARQIKEMS